MWWCSVVENVSHHHGEIHQKWNRPRVTILFFPRLEEFTVGHKEWLFTYVVLQQRNGTENV